MRHIFRVLLLLTCTNVYAEKSVSIASVEVNLFYEESGRFSKNILGKQDFVLWNTVIGEGSAAEPSDRFLIRIRFNGPPESFVDESVGLKVYSKESGKLYFSEIFNGFLFPKSGITHRAVLISGHNCDSSIIRAGDTSHPIDFQCGE